MRHRKNTGPRVLMCGGLLTWLLVVTPTSTYTGPRFPQSTVLSAEDIAEAVELGQNGEVRPYVLKRALGGGGGSRPRAAIYTPFVRVALAAKARVLTFDGSTVVSQVAPQWITSPEVLVVFGSPCPGAPCEAGGDSVDPTAINPIGLSIRAQVNPSSPPAAAAPIRVIPLRDLTWLGTISVEEPLVAATFSPHAFTDGSRVVAEWGDRFRTVWLSGGHLQAAELETWR